MAPMSSAEFTPLLQIARRAIEAAARGSAWQPDATGFAPVLARPGACFVTLMRATQLRGCIGTLEPVRPLFEDAARNAVAAAIRDRRFPPLDTRELDEVSVEISVLGPQSAILAASRAELLAALVPGEDGLIITEGPHCATFLPSVWAQLPDPEAFLGRLLEKAGLDARYWSPQLRTTRYRTHSVREHQVPA